MGKLATVFGQETAIKALRRALQAECLPGAYLFVGAEGTGKTAVAQAFAQAAACLSPIHEPFDPCGDCDSCRRAEAGSHPEIVTIRPAGEQLQIWQLWDRQGRQAPGVLSRSLSYAPVVGRRRVYILEKADRLTEQAANSLLKILEEPPPYALFLLLAPHPARVLPTIISRCQIVRLGAIGVSELAAYLERSLQIDAARAAMVAAYAEGRIGQAISLARESAVAEEITHILDYAEGLPEAPPYRALKAAEQLRRLAAQTKALVGEEVPDAGDAAGTETEGGTAKEKTGRKQFAAVFDLLVTFYRDLLALSVGAAQSRLINQDRISALARLSKHGNPGRWTQCLDALVMARRRLDANANTALVTEILVMRLLAR